MNTQDFINQNLLNSAAYIEECACCKPMTNEDMLATLGWLVLYIVVIGFVTVAIGLATIWVTDKFLKMMG